MKLLFDENLSHKLPGLVVSTFPPGQYLIVRHTQDIIAFETSPESILVLS